MRGPASETEITDLSDDLEEPARLLSSPSSVLLPHPKPGDWVRYFYVDSQCSEMGLARSERLSSELQGPLGDCLRSMRLGEVRAVKGTDKRIKLTGHVPRHHLELGGFLDILELKASHKRPLAGMTVFAREDETETRHEIPVSGASTSLQEALLLLKVGERARYTLQDEAKVLEVLHAARLEDISLFGDGSLWKLSLKAPLGSFECPRLGTVVSAVVNGRKMSWTWGHGEVENLLEFSAARIGSGEEAEIRKDEEILYVICMEHIGKDPEYVAAEVRYEEHVHAAAREVFENGNAELAWWHWDHLRTLLAPACDKNADLQDEEVQSQRALAVKVLGALSGCDLHMGRTGEACASALKTLEMLGDEAKAKDVLRLAAAASANKDEELALEACERGLALPDIDAFEKAAFDSIKIKVARARQRHLAAERAFCKRIFA